MIMKIVRKIGYTGVAALLLSASILAGSPVTPPSQVAVEASEWDFRGEAANLLREMQALSGKLDTDADQLASFSRSNLSWESHAQQLSAVRENINTIGERLARLQEIRHVTSPWQQQAIDRVVPVAAGVASHTQAAIEHLNDNRSYLFAPAYNDHLNAIADGAERMKASLDTFLDYGSTQQKLERLQQKLEVT
jgi:hypothetical protein